MTRPRKRLSAGMGLRADGIDPLFEFDVSRLFVDLTRRTPLPRGRRMSSLGGMDERSGHGEATTEEWPRDPWFQLIHEEHSRPTDEILAAAMAQQQQQQQHQHQHQHQQHHHRHMASHTSELPADWEKENRDDRVTVGSGAHATTVAKDGSLVRRRKRSYGASASYPPDEPVKRMAATVRTVAATTTVGTVAFGHKTMTPPTRTTALSTTMSSTTTKRTRTRSSIVQIPTKTGYTGGRGESVRTRARPRPGTALVPTSAIRLRTNDAEMNTRRGLATPSNGGRSTGASTSSNTSTMKPKANTSAGMNHRRRSTATTTTTSRSTASKDLRDLEALLAKHNKKFKATHTYEPRHHSVRDVRRWEKQTQQSYYKLSLTERKAANAEITAFVKQERQHAKTAST